MDSIFQIRAIGQCDFYCIAKTAEATRGTKLPDPGYPDSFLRFRQLSLWHYEELPLRRLAVVYAIESALGMPSKHIKICGP